jgi:hypothetical protein
MVIEVFISSGMPSNRVRMSPRWRNRHADLADLAAASTWSVVAGLGRQIERDAEAGLALGEVGAVELVRLLGRGMTGIGADEPGLVAASIAAAGASC